MPHQFTISMDSGPDALVGLVEALAERDIDLRAIGLSDSGRKTMAVLITNDDPATRTVLRAGHHAFFEGDVVMAAVPDQPGALAHLVRYLAERGIRLRGVLLLRWHQGKAELALSADDPAGLRRSLEGYTRYLDAPRNAVLAHSR